MDEIASYEMSISGDIGESAVIAQSTDDGGYSRPSDWLDLPAVNEGDEKVVGLYAIYNTDSNFVALECE